MSSRLSDDYVDIFFGFVSVNAAITGLYKTLHSDMTKEMRKSGHLLKHKSDIDKIFLSKIRKYGDLWDLVASKINKRMKVTVLNAGAFKKITMKNWVFLHKEDALI